MCERAKTYKKSCSTSDADFRQHDGRAMVSMTFCRTVLFDEKKEVPDQVGEDNAIGGVAGCSPQRG